MRGNQGIHLGSPFWSPPGRRPPQHEFHDRQQPLRYLQVSLVASCVKRDHDVVRYPATSLWPAPRRGVRVGDGIVHVDHHFPRTALYSSIARFHVDCPIPRCPQRLASAKRLPCPAERRIGEWASVVAKFAAGQPVDCIGRSGGIRTHDPQSPRLMRYQAALRSDRGEGGSSSTDPRRAILGRPGLSRPGLSRPGGW